jgi:hypothetical protein
MPHPEPDNGVVSSLEGFAESVHQVTTERIIPVSTHRWIPHAFAQARTGPVKESPDQRTDAFTQAARGLLIVAVVLGALGTAGTVSPGHGSVGLASDRQSDSRVDLAVSLSQVSSDPILPNPWMY